MYRWYPSYFNLSHRGRSSSSRATMRFCSASGGRGIIKPLISFCEMFFIESEVPVATASIWLLKVGLRMRFKMNLKSILPEKVMRRILSESISFFPIWSTITHSHITKTRPKIQAKAIYNPTAGSADSFESAGLAAGFNLLSEVHVHIQGGAGFRIAFPRRLFAVPTFSMMLKKL